MTTIFVKLIANAVALAAAVWLVNDITIGEPGESTGGKAVTLLIVALIFGVVNLVVKPVVKLFALPLLILTLGLFTLVINALMLLLTDWLSGDRFEVEGFGSAVLGGLIISIVSWAVNLILDRD
ncbi:phage holin family protein [Streptomyces sp. 3MP-14]|uniref:Phage holin family protein n=1 Tax=Streptomyces mimosae TaxID=2586635 RepID=A0A5N6A4X0_9ACTN|nr:MULTISPECIES: phage holin family protein [Streptomyces]KAB8163292.1 phage holin family protein [Streptomyces mimosae]KAB8174569.1 phage holin family protein [Streptomyces sp. 3MP-14]